MIENNHFKAQFIIIVSVIVSSILPLCVLQTTGAVCFASGESVSSVQYNYHQAKNAAIAWYTLKDVMTNPGVRQTFFKDALAISGQFQLTKSAHDVNTLEAFQDFQYAQNYTQEQILTDPAKAREFLDLFCTYESRFIRQVNSETSSMTFDGYWLSTLFDIMTARDWSAASKEAQELALLIKLLAVEPDPLAVKLFDAASVAEAQSRALDLARKKIDLYLLFNRDFPAFAGFLPWFHESQADSSKIAPSDDWLNTFPTLDNGEFFWMIFIMWHTLDELYQLTADASIDSTADLYRDYFQIIIQNIPKAAYFETSPYPGVNGYIPAEVEIIDRSLDSVVASNYRDKQYASGYYLNDMYEGLMLILFTNLFCNDLSATQRGALLGNVGYDKVELSKTRGDSCNATIWRGHWNSAHEEWAWLFLPFFENDVANNLFDVRQKVRSIYSQYGYNSSINQPGREAYVSACGIPGLPEAAYKHEVLYPDVYAPSAAWPLVLNDRVQNNTLEQNSYGLAALLHMIQPKGVTNPDSLNTSRTFTMQGPYGFLEAYDRQGHVSLLKTVDGSYLLYLAMLGGTWQECARALDNTSLYHNVLDWYSRYDGFKQAWNAKINDAFGSNTGDIADPGYYRQLEKQVNTLVDFNIVPLPVTQVQDILGDVWRFPGKDRWRGNAEFRTEHDSVLVIAPQGSGGWGWVSGGTYEDIVPDSASAFFFKGYGKFTLKLETFRYRDANFTIDVELLGENEYTKIDLAEAFGNQYFIITLDSIWNDLRISEFWYDPDGDGIFTAVEITDKVLPQTFHLAQNYPNPFNPVTSIKYTVPTPARVEIAIFNILGNKVRTLIDKDHRPGEFELTWHGKDDRQQPVSSGVYFCTMTSAGFAKTIKLMLVR